MLRTSGSYRESASPLLALLWITVVALPFGPTVTAAGEVLAIESVLVRVIDDVDVPAREAGALSEVLVREGMAVAKGDLLARIDDTSSRLDKRRAELELKLARMEADNDVSVRFSEKSRAVSAAELRRAVESDKKYSHSVSESELEQLRLAVARGALEIEQAKHQRALATASKDLKENQLEVAEWGVRRCAVLSPVAGVVVQVHRRPGEWMNPGDPVVRVVRIDRLRAEGFLPARLAAQALVGRPVALQVEVAGDPAGRFGGTVVFVSPEADPVNRQVRIWAEIDNRELRLKPGLRGTMTIDGAATARNASSD